MKGKMSKLVVRQVVQFGLERVTPRRRQEAETKMLKFSLVSNRMERIRNENIRGAAR